MPFKRVAAILGVAAIGALIVLGLRQSDVTEPQLVRSNERSHEPADPLAPSSLTTQAASPRAVPIVAIEPAPLAPRTREVLAGGSPHSPSRSAATPQPFEHGLPRRNDAVPLHSGPASDLSEVPAHWTITGSAQENYTLLTSRELVLTGKASAKLVAVPDADLSRFGATMQSASAARLRGQRLELSAYIAVEDAPAGAAIWLRANDADGVIVGFENTLARGVSGTAPWSYQSIVMDIPESAVALSYGAILMGRGVLYVDDVQFRSVDSNTPATASPPPRRPDPPRFRVDQSLLAPEPRNLDFEETIARPSAP